MFKYLLCVAIVLVFSLESTAKEIHLYENQKTTLPINPNGSLVEFPRPVIVVGDSAHYKIEEVATEFEEKSGQPVNIKILKVTSKNRGSSPEEVPVVLSGNKSFVLRFKRVPNASKYFSMKLGGENTHARVISQTNFLTNELTLMKDMINEQEENETGFNVEMISKPILIKSLPKNLKMRATKKYTGKSLTGYVFKVTNSTDETLSIDPRNLYLGLPNRAVLMHTDRIKLDPCPDLTEPTCEATIKIVTRDQDYVHPSNPADIPFIFTRGANL